MFQASFFLQEIWTANNGDQSESNSNLKFGLQFGLIFCILIQSAMYLEKPFILRLGTLKMLYKMKLLSDIF